MEETYPDFETFYRFKIACQRMVENPNDETNLEQLNKLVKNASKNCIKVVQPTVLASFYPIIKAISVEDTRFGSKFIHKLIDTLTDVFEKSIIDKMGIFFNMYSLLLYVIYDSRENRVLPIPEEMKLSVMLCTKALARSVSTDLLPELYNKVNAPKLCQMIYVALELAKFEKLRSLRIAAMECIMCIAQVFDDENFHDIVLRRQLAEVFMFFLPGIASGILKILLEDSKVGSKVQAVALKTWGRIVTLVMQNYDATSSVPNIVEFTRSVKNDYSKDKDTPIKKCTNNAEVTEYIETTKLNKKFYVSTDQKLQMVVKDFYKVLHCADEQVRLELLNMCQIIMNNCLGTMPLSSSHLIEIVISLTEDADKEVSKKSTQILSDLSNLLSSESLKAFIEGLEEGFITDINALPRRFNSIDEKEQLASLNLLIGYLNLFGEHKLQQVLLSANYLDTLLTTLLYICELEKCDIGLVEEYTTKDLHYVQAVTQPWMKFTRFKENTTLYQVQKLCSLLGKYGTFRLVSDFLLDVIMYNEVNRKEAIFILNEVISGINNDKEGVDIIANIFETYIDDKYYQVPLEVSEDVNRNEVLQNIIQVCLLTEGIGKIALKLKQGFHQFMLKILFIVLEKTGSSYEYIKIAGLKTLHDITSACGYSDFNDLITSNIDYLTYHIERKLKSALKENREHALDVLTVLLQYCTAEILEHLKYIINTVIDSFNDFGININSYLQVFKVTVQVINRWWPVEIIDEDIKPKAEKIKEVEDFKVTGADKVEDNFSDEIMGKTAEEMYEEDRLKKEEQLKMDTEEVEEEEYKKPDPPTRIKITVSILKQSLHFLPSSIKSRKILVLDILTDGIEIIKDYEDELLPIVHLIWSPLVSRFDETGLPVVMTLSFKLLMVLARVSKEFIRMRTTKEVLPKILKFMNDLSKDSHLKDRGAQYRYSQNYKFQQIVLRNLAKVLIYLDVADEHVHKTMDCFRLYLSDKQPKALQDAALHFFVCMARYDPPTVVNKINSWEKEDCDGNIKTMLLDTLNHKQTGIEE
ncbi:TELO2-interacting protein 1 homolog [Diabrotica virgifera virgifera]|uniref:TELO2-interacting protein 1 homolog n=1 Tax=Diabrotica virgifera virgifera TaxID=50390 RepID=A0ABM5IZW7_DIAVI|nr:TELO2-interacting protein 1 homolog [Diabrotica virgifera virgifera]